MADRNNPELLYLQVANYMREKIYDHEWKTNQQIPTEARLMEEFGMSRGTIRRALKELVGEGLLVARCGRGTFVTSKSVAHPTGGSLVSFAESLRSQGLAYTTRVLRQEVMQADDFVAARLSTPVGSPVLALERLRSVDGDPLIYLESRINLGLCSGLEATDLAANSLFDVVEQVYHKRIGYSHAQYAAMVAGERRGELLGVSPEAPVLHLEQQVMLNDNTPFEWSNVWLRANRYIVGAVLQRI